MEGNRQGGRGKNRKDTVLAIREELFPPRFKTKNKTSPSKTPLVSCRAKKILQKFLKKVYSFT